jgi:hypothetical protein
MGESCRDADLATAESEVFPGVSRQAAARGTNCSVPAAGIPVPGPGAGIRRAIRIGSRPGPWKRGPALAAPAPLLGLSMLLHSHTPNRIGNLGSLVETFLPWFGLFVPCFWPGRCGAAPQWPRCCCRSWCG